MKFEGSSSLSEGTAVFLFRAPRRPDRFLIPAFLLLCVALPFFPAAGAAEPPDGPMRLADVAPVETVLYVECSGLDVLKRKLKNLDLHALWMEEEVQAFMKDLRAAMEARAQEPSREGPFSLKELWKAFQGPLALALSSRTSLFEEGILPSAAVAVGLGPDRERFLQAVDGLARQVASKKSLERTGFEYRGIEIHLLRRPRRRAELCRAVVGNLFLLASNRYFLQEIIDHYLDRTPSLAQLPSYRKTMTRVGGEGADLLAFVNLEPILRVVRPVAPYEVEAWARLLGVEGMDALCFASVLEGGCSKDSFFIHCPGKKHGLLAALASRPVDPENARRAPPGTVYFVDVAFDPERFLKELEHVVSTALPEVYPGFQHGFDQIRRQAGVDVQKDLLGPLGDEIWISVGFPKQGGPTFIPEVILSVRLDDGKAFEAGLEKILARVDEIEVAETSFEEGTIRYIRPRGGEGIPVSPAFTVEKDRLMAATTPLVLKKYLRWLHGRTPGLAGNEGFRKAVAQVPEGASAVKYLDFPRLVEMGYNLASTFLPAVLSESGLPLDPGLLPMTDTLVRHMEGAVGYFLMDEDGLMVTVRSPLGLGALFAAWVGIADWAVDKGIVPGKFHWGRRVWKHGKGNASVRAGSSVRTELEMARELMTGGQCGVAEQLITAWIRKHEGRDPEAGRAFMARGFCRMKLERWQEALEDYGKAADLAPDLRPVACYNQACAAARMGDKNRALTLLESAVEAGWKDREHLSVDPDLDGIRQDPRFKAILKRLDEDGRRS